HCIAFGLPVRQPKSRLRWRGITYEGKRLPVLRRRHVVLDYVIFIVEVDRLVAFAVRAAIDHKQIFVSGSRAAVGRRDVIAVFAHQHFAVEFQGEGEAAAALAGLSFAFADPFAQEKAVRGPRIAFLFCGRPWGQKEEPEGRQCQSTISHLHALSERRWYTKS